MAAAAQVVPIAIKAAFLNAGQNCAGGERFLVQAGIYDAYLDRVRPAPPTACRLPATCPASTRFGNACWELEGNSCTTMV